MGEWNDRWMSAGGERRRQNQSVLNVMFFFVCGRCCCVVGRFFYFSIFPPLRLTQLILGGGFEPESPIYSEYDTNFNFFFLDFSAWHNFERFIS